MQRPLFWALALAAFVAACGGSDGAAPETAPSAASEAPAQPEAPAPAARAVEPASTEAAPAAASPNGGAKLSLPRGFPSDLPIPEGLTVKSVLSEQPGSFVALFTGERDPEAVQREFEGGLEAQGWTIQKRRGDGLDLGLYATKDGRIASVITTRLDGRLHVEVGVSGGS